MFFDVIKKLNISEDKFNYLMVPCKDSAKLDVENEEFIFIDFETTRGAYSVNESIEFCIKINNKTKKKLKSLKC